MSEGTGLHEMSSPRRRGLWWHTLCWLFLCCFAKQMSSCQSRGTSVPPLGLGCRHEGFEEDRHEIGFE